MKPELARGLKEAAQAIAAGVVIILVLAALFTLTGCAAWREYPTEVRMWAAWDPRDGDKYSPIGRQPTGNIMITQPLPAYLEVSYQHISSIQDYYDRGTIDQFGVGFCVRVPLRDCR